MLHSVSVVGVKGLCKGINIPIPFLEMEKSKQSDLPGRVSWSISRSRKRKQTPQLQSRKRP